MAWNGTGLMITPQAWAAEDPRYNLADRPAWCRSCRTTVKAEEIATSACGRLRACENDLNAHESRCPACRRKAQ